MQLGEVGRVDLAVVHDEDGLRMQRRRDQSIDGRGLLVVVRDDAEEQLEVSVGQRVRGGRGRDVGEVGGVEDRAGDLGDRRRDGSDDSDDGRIGGQAFRFAAGEPGLVVHVARLDGERRPVFGVERVERHSRPVHLGRLRSSPAAPSEAITAIVPVHATAPLPASAALAVGPLEPQPASSIAVPSSAALIASASGVPRLTKAPPVRRRRRSRP